MSVLSHLLIWGLLILVQTAHSDPAHAQTPIAQSGRTSVGAKSGKATAKVTVHTVTIESSNNAFPSDWASDTRAVAIVKDLNISVNNESLAVPRSVFADLIDPRDMSIRSEKGVFVLTVGGGDAADAYFVRIYFDATRVTRRMVYSSLNPDEVEEVTRYWVRVLRDKE